VPANNKINAPSEKDRARRRASTCEDFFSIAQEEG
jgi:hypothetical protein